MVIAKLRALASALLFTAAIFSLAGSGWQALLCAGLAVWSFADALSWIVARGPTMFIRRKAPAA